MIWGDKTSSNHINNNVRPLYTVGYDRLKWLEDNTKEYNVPLETEAKAFINDVTNEAQQDFNSIRNSLLLGAKLLKFGLIILTVGYGFKLLTGRAILS